MFAALAALALGYWGFRTSPATEQGNGLDAAYRTIRLFGLSAGDIDPPVSWQLQIARVLAPLLVGYAAFQGILALFREHFLLLRLRFFARRHVVVAGLGSGGFRLVRALHDAGVQVVAIEKTASLPEVTGCRARGIPVVVGDASDTEKLRQAQCLQASHVVALCGDDSVNLEILGSCVALAAAPGWMPAHVHIQLETLSLWRNLRLASAARKGDAKLRVEFFSVTDLAARALARSVKTRVSSSSAAFHLIVDGCGEVVQRLIQHLVRDAGASQKVLRVSLIGEGSGREVANAVGEEKTTVKLLDMDAIESTATTRPSSELRFAVERADMAIVCRGNDAEALASGSALARLGCDDVLVSVSNGGIGESLGASGLPPGLELISVQEAVLGPSILTGTITESIARARHAIYVRNELRKGESLETNPSMAEWSEIDEGLRESNRQFADSVGEKLSALGLMLEPKEFGAGPPEEDYVVPPKMLEELARDEHDRWVASKLAQGWSPSGGLPKNSLTKVHPLLVPWDELDEAEREKDRDGVRGLPELFDAAGFAIVRRKDSSAGSRHRSRSPEVSSRRG
jgi:Trk K+ transport system NAD-binding subunit